ncbi:MAG: protein kinase [Acidobacteria bacterium]|nr:protein kinase [Acidobacteriota bacterium]
MKECPSCRRCYEDNSNFCPIDGVGLSYSVAGPRLLAGKYRLERLIARGGMGGIYQAIQEGLARTIAVKILNPEFVNNQNALERFRREALAIAGLKHPNIVTIYDFGITQNGGSYIAMEYLKGRSLSRILSEEKKLSIERTLTIIEPICQALTEAHEKGIIHRDLKPDNIMLEQVGNSQVVKVVDFGLAKLKQRAEQRRITGNLVVGTFDYMSPEQCQSMELEATSDVYSLGIVIYEMLTSQVPFRNASRLATIYQHINDPPRPPRAHASEVPDRIEKVILRALSKEPAERQQSALELLEEMQTAFQVTTKSSGSTNLSGQRNSSARGQTGYLNRVEARKSPNATLKKHLIFSYFLAREKELNRLTTEFAFIRSGRTKPIIVLGDAGIGKTELITEFRRRISEGEALFLSGRFFDYLGTSPYKPLLDALTTHIRQIISQQPLFEKIFGELADRIRDDLANDWNFWTIDQGKSGSLQGGPEGEKYRIFEYLAQVYIKLARHLPIVIWMDDMQWADGLSLNFMSYLLRRTLGEPIQFIFTARIQDVTQKGHPFQQWQNSVANARNIEQLQLFGLSTSDVDQYIKLVFTDIEISSLSIDRIWQETQGNPYFLSETLRLLVEEERIIWTGQKWRCPQLTEINLPSSVVNIVESHLRRFKENELDVFMQGAVLGDQFSFETLRLVTNLGEDELIDIVEIGLAGYVLKEQPLINTQSLRPTISNIDELYSFYHTTVRKVLYSKINTRRRRRLHLRVAEALEKAKKERLDQIAPLLAHHYYNAEQYQFAFKYSVDAATAAWRALAVEETEKYLARLQELLDQIEEAQSMEYQAQSNQITNQFKNQLLAVSLAQYRILSGEVLTALGKFADAERSLFIALKLSEHIDNGTIAGRAILATGEMYKERSDSERALKFFQHAFDVHKKLNDVAGQCQALNRIATVNYEKGEYSQANDYASSCFQLAQSSGEKISQASAKIILAATDFRLARYSRAMEGVREVLSLAQSAQDKVLERQACAFLGVISSVLGFYPAAINWLDQALQITRDTGARRSEARFLVELGEVHRKQGEYEEAIDYFSQAYEIATELRAKREQEIALLDLSLVYKMLNYPDQALNYLNQAISVSKEVCDPVLIVEEKGALAELTLLTEKKADALALTHEAISLARQIKVRAQLWQLLYLQAKILKELKQNKKAIESVQESISILKAISSEITDEQAKKSFLSDKNYVVQLLNQLKG